MKPARNKLYFTACWRGLGPYKAPKMPWFIRCSRTIRRKLNKVFKALDPRLLLDKIQMKEVLASLGLIITSLTHVQTAHAVDPVATNALPTGSEIIAGGISIEVDGLHMEIGQSATQGIINWDTFNIGSNASVNIDNNGGATLNRVQTNNPSYIMGQLSSNGTVMILNQNGVVFGANSRVDVNGLVASSADIRNEDFLNENYDFSIKGSETAQIINNGRIEINNAGLGAFVAPTLVNNGTITAHMGKFSMGTGNRWALDMGGLVKLEVDDEIVGQLIQDGTINAEGGIVQLTTNQVQGMVQNALEMNGTISTQTIDTSQGAIIINGGNYGVVEVAGTLDASGNDTGEVGGAVHVTGELISIAQGSKINASGDSGGGEILIGGEYLGGSELSDGSKYAGGLDAEVLNAHRGGISSVNNSEIGEYLANYYSQRNADGGLKTATSVKIADNAKIDANAITSGDGGRAIVWADLNTWMYGDIDVSAGAQNGDGGFIETSGKNWLDMQGSVDMSSVNGEAGTWLLDPFDITITNNAGSHVNLDTAGNWYSSATGSIVDTALLETALGLGNLIIETNSGGGGEDGDVTFASAMTINESGKLTINADNDIIWNATYTNSGTGGLALNAGGDGAGNIDINSAITAGGAMTMTATGGTITVDSDLTSDTRIRFNSDATIDGDATFDAGAIGDLRFNAISMGANDLTLLSRTITLTGSVTSTTGDLSLNSNTTTMGLGDGSTGDFNLTDAELDFINIGGELEFNGSGAAGTDIDIRRSSAWSDDVVFKSTVGGSITVNSAQTFDGDAEFETTDGGAININAALNSGAGGSHYLYFDVWDDAFAIGSGVSGDVTLSQAELDFIEDDGWTRTYFREFGSGSIELGTASFDDESHFYSTSNSINVDGAITVTDDGRLDFNHGTTISASGSIDGSASSGEIEFSGTLDTSGNITSGAGGIDLQGAVTVSDDVILNAGTGTITTGSTITSATGDLTLTADEIILGDNINGGGSNDLTIQTSTNSTDINLNDGTSGLDLSLTELGYLGGGSGWNSLTIGNGSHTGVIDFGNWTYGGDLNLRGGSFSATGDLNIGANALGVYANTGNIGHTIGTLTAGAAIFDSPGSITANIDFDSLDFGSNATSATLSGLLNSAADQDAADTILGGPGNDSSYKFNNFIIRLVAMMSNNTGNGTGRTDYHQISIDEPLRARNAAVKMSTLQENFDSMIKSSTNNTDKISNLTKELYFGNSESIKPSSEDVKDKK